MTSKAKRQRQKAERAGRLNPEINRREWNRKPITQTVRNEKAQQRRSFCRRSKDDGAFLLLRKAL